MVIDRKDRPLKDRREAYLPPRPTNYQSTVP